VIVYRIRNKNGKYFRYNETDNNKPMWVYIDDANLFASKGIAEDEAMEYNGIVEKCVITHMEDIE
jgi:hypothetical protein